MRYLLDTHTFLWFIEDNPKLSSQAKAQIEDENNEKLFSAASYWEIAIKLSLGKLVLKEPFATLLPREIASNSFTILPIALDHAATVVTLPHHHRDPFDRLLIAQSIVEGLPIVSADSAFDAYGITRVW